MKNLFALLLTFSFTATTVANDISILTDANLSEAKVLEIQSRVDSLSRNQLIDRKNVLEAKKLNLKVTKMLHRTQPLIKNYLIQ
jgi:hypothetical protein